jgi:proteasome lid subunit RPN8/RPN11
MPAERIGRLSEMPERLLLGRECLIVLKRILAAPAPEEGCALLLGRSVSGGASRRSAWWVQKVWPCCNVWSPGLAALPEPEPPDASLTRRHRFALDPREQLHAQRWARARGLQVLGTAHSHPEGEPEPSRIDLGWATTPSLMLILGGSGALGAWWIEAGAASPLLLQHTEELLQHTEGELS